MLRIGLVRRNRCGYEKSVGGEHDGHGFADRGGALLDTGGCGAADAARQKRCGARTGLRASEFIEALDSQPLKMRGLPRARYVLRIDGDYSGRLSAGRTCGGLNLALLPTPMARQALDVHALTLKRNQIHYERWPHLQVPLQDLKSERLQPALDSLDALEADLIEQQRSAAQPSPHYELSPE